MLPFRVLGHKPWAAGKNDPGSGTSLGNTPVSDLNLSLTGAQQAVGQGQAGQAAPKKYTITDKHGIGHDACNMRIAVERSGSFPLYLGDEAGFASP